MEQPSASPLFTQKLIQTPAWTWDRQDAHDDKRMGMRIAQSNEFAHAEVVAAERAIQAALLLPEDDPERERLTAEAKQAITQAERTQACARNVRRFVKKLNDTTSTVALSRAWFCNRPGCVICNQVKARKLLRSVIKRFMRARKHYPGLAPVEITLTQEALVEMDQLGEGIAKLIANLQKLLKSAEFRNAFVGGFYRIEISFNKEQRKAHVHCHAIMCAADEGYFSDSRYIAQPKLLRLWNRINQTDRIIAVNIRRVRDPATNGTDSVSVLHGFVHCAKYAFKPMGFFEFDETGSFFIEPEVAAALTRGMKGRNMHQFVGCLREDWLKKRDL